MKKIIFLLLFLSGITTYSQAYYPKLDNLFLQSDSDESVFSDDLNYFKEELKRVTSRLFYSNLQTSGSTHSAFYGLNMIPRGTNEFDFLETGMILKYNPNQEEKFPSFPMTFQEYAQVNKEGRIGKGYSEILGGISLVFDKKQVTPLDKNKRTLKDSKAEFVIRRIEYQIENNILTIELTGDFSTDIKIKKSKLDKQSTQKLFISVSKNSFLVSSENKSEIIVEKKI